MPDDKPIYGLICAGGGAHGAYQVGVLKYIHEHFCNGEASPFRAFSGTSAGSLNTCFFAARSFDAHLSRLRLEDLWLNFHVPEYHGNIVRNSIHNLVKDWAIPGHHRSKTWSLLDPAPLHDVVAEGFTRPDFERAINEGTTIGLAVSATEIKSSRLVWFQEGPATTEWITPWSNSIQTELSVPHVQASCSVPVVFPPVEIDGYTYADGGVANKHPFSPAIGMGATRILSIATDQPLPTELPDSAAPKTSVRNVVNMLATQLSHDYAPDQARDLDMLNYFREQQPEGDAPSNMARIAMGRHMHLSSYRPVEVHLFSPSQRIRHTDIFHPEMFEVALDAKSTSLLFHRDFIRPLIELGYEDGKNRHDELARFFDRDRPQAPSRFRETDEGERVR